MSPIVDLVKSASDIDETDPEDEMDAKLTARVAEVGGDPAHLPYLRYLLSIDPGSAVAEEDPMLRKPRVFEAFRDVLLAAAQRVPVVLVIEDLHWIDPPSAELLSFVAEAVPRHKILVAPHASAGVGVAAGRATVLHTGRARAAVRARHRPGRAGCLG